VARYGTVFKPGKLVTLFAIALAFSCSLIPVGTQTRTGLICLVILIAAIAAHGEAAAALHRDHRRARHRSRAVPAAKLHRAHEHDREPQGADQSASTRMAVWKWTIDFAKLHPFGGGFEAYRQNSFSYDTVKAENAGDNNTAIETERIEEKARAYHSGYFEMLGEQGYPGLALWLILHFSGLLQLELIQRRLRRRDDAESRSDRSLALALQSGHCVYLFGALFVGIAFQPFIFMLIGLQIALAMQVARRLAPPLEWQRRKPKAAVASPEPGDAPRQPGNLAR
jgi:O-antigen ligase